MEPFLPPGFVARRVATPLGQMVYAAPPSAAVTGTPLVFFHSLGGGSSAYEWSQVFPAFSTDYPILAPDLLGWGASAHPKLKYEAADYFQMFRSVLEQLSEPAVICATSLTASLVVRLLTTWPTDTAPPPVKGLFLVAPSGYEDFGNAYRNSLPALLAGTPGLEDLIYQLGAANPVAVSSFLQQVLFADPARLTPETIAAYLASAQQPNAQASALASLKGSLCSDLARYVGRLTVPTWLVYGVRSRFSSGSIGHRLVQLNPDHLTCRTIPDCGVLPQLEQPAIVIGLLQQFLQRHP